MSLIKKRSVIGLEIDTGEARAVELSPGTRGPGKIVYERINLPDGAVVDGNVAEPEVVAGALKQLWSSAGFKSREVVLGVANKAVLVRFATLPKVPEDKIARMIRFQAQEYLPVDLSSTVWDFAVINELDSDRGPQVEVLLVAAMREMLEVFLSTLSAAELAPLDINYSGLALLRIWPAEKKTGAIVMVDVANGVGNILVEVDGVLRLARMFFAGLQDAAVRLGCDLSEVVPLPAAEAVQPWPQDILLDWGENLADEIRSSIGYLQMQTGIMELDGILLSGRGTRVDGLAQLLQQSLGMPVKVLHEVFPEPDFAVSTGLARYELEG
ncbi:MAG: pilus assembly protein PilM [Desulfotomaculaceae bacterium]|nr:pilus assembly protein PilM [Desulfotomaculaceae bacterium]